MIITNLCKWLTVNEDVATDKKLIICPKTKLRYNLVPAIRSCEVMKRQKEYRQSAFKAAVECWKLKANNEACSCEDIK